MKDLAVIIPTFNDTPALLRTLDSIDEDESSFTVVIVDDGSSEAVHFDTSKYPFRIEILRKDENGGIVKALNLGLRFAQSERFQYIARLDAADRNRSNRFGIQHDYLQANSHLAMVGANAVFRNEHTDAPILVTKLPLSTRDTKRWMVFRNCFVHPTVMFRIDLLDRCGFYDDRFPHIEDYVFFSRIVDAAEAENLETPLVDCLVREGGISRLNWRSQLVSGLKFKLLNPKPLDPLWYAFLLKRSIYLVLPLGIQYRIRRWLGFVRPDE
jgi:glycosyltransferase involved in cell wall biosynthesis